MSITRSLYHTYQRYRTLKTDRITALPIVILMPHGACNCRCVMCDIWKGNKNLKQLTESDISALLSSLKKFGTQQVLMSGGEALLNPHFFRFCEILVQHNIRVTLLSTGITLKKNAASIVEWVNDVIVSLDGDEAGHDQIRNLPGAFQKLKEGIQAIRALYPKYPVSSRSVIHRLNFRNWPALIDSAIELGLDRASFLPADVSSHAFNREISWSEERQQEIIPDEKDLPELRAIIDRIIKDHADHFASGFMAESPGKLENIYKYYAAFYGYNSYPYKKCNAPWVSAVIEADGAVRPCFFHESVGNIREHSLEDILNGEAAMRFRKGLDMDEHPTCLKCVCYLHLSPRTNLNG